MVFSSSSVFSSRNYYQFLDDGKSAAAVAAAFGFSIMAPDGFGSRGGNGRR